MAKSVEQTEYDENSHSTTIDERIMKKNNDWKDRLGVVFSTNPDFAYQDEDQQPMDSLAPGQQKLRLRIEKNGRGGKTVTVVSGFVGKEEELKELARMLKTRCGVGGSCKEGEIIIQGDFKNRIIDILKQEGYTNSK